jgi:hypothetical protein
MRTTLNVDDDVLDYARRVAHIRSISIGEALSELARRGMNARVPTRLDPLTGLTIFDVPKGTRKIILDDIQRALDDADYEEYAPKAPTIDRFDPSGSGHSQSRPAGHVRPRIPTPEDSKFENNQ